MRNNFNQYLLVSPNTSATWAQMEVWCSVRSKSGLLEEDEEAGYVDSIIRLVLRTYLTPAIKVVLATPNDAILQMPNYLPGKSLKIDTYTIDPEMRFVELMVKG